MSDDDEFVLLKEHHDPVQAEMMADLLEQEDIRVSTSGLNHRALLGMVGSFVEITIRVRESQLEEAKELLAALEDGEVVPDAESAYDADEDEEDGEPVVVFQKRADARRKRIVWGAAFLLPGGAHFYARDTVRGLAIVLGYLVVVASTVLWDTTAVWMLPVVLLADMFGGFEAVDRFNTMRTSQTSSARFGRWFAWSAPLLALVPQLGTFTLLVTAPGLYLGGGGEAVCEHLASCRGVSGETCVRENAALVQDGTRTRARFDECAACLGELRCDDVWQQVTCSPEPDSGFNIVFNDPFAAPMSECVAGPRVYGVCQTACRDLLPNIGRPARPIEPLRLDPGLLY